MAFFLTYFHYFYGMTKYPSSKESIELRDIDPEDLEEVLFKIEKSFDIRFEANELKYIDTFGGLCDHIKDKFDGQSSDDCTGQQAFYKLRDALVRFGQVDIDRIKPELALTELFPKEDRKTRVKELESVLKFKLDILGPSRILSNSLQVLLIGALIVLCFKWKIGLPVFILLVISLKLAFRFGKELQVETVRELVEKMTRDNYIKSRRDNNNYNLKEINKVLIDLFSNALGIDKSNLKAESSLR